MAAVGILRFAKQENPGRMRKLIVPLYQLEIGKPANFAKLYFH
jgi:hypothetical protein